MKFVYVLSSSEKDFLTEQAMVSMYSLKMHNPEAQILLCVDKETYDGLDEGRARIKDYADEIKIFDLPVKLLPIQKSRYIKTSLRQNIKGDFAYIDSDTVITGDLMDLEQIPGDVCMVKNRNDDVWNKNNPHPQIEEYKVRTKYSHPIDKRIEKFYNGGFILCRDSKKGHEFFELWHKLWNESMSRGFNQDQPDLWRANVLCSDVITPLNGIYNCQIIYPIGALRFILDSRVLHYFGSVNKKLQAFNFKSSQFLKKIRKSGIDEEISKSIRDVKVEYMNNIESVILQDVVRYQTPMIILGMKLSRDFPYLNKLVRRIYGLFGYKI